jgi:hypothetical protein
VIAELIAVAAAMWQTGPALPVPRSEVAGAAGRDQVIVAGGVLARTSG